MTILLKCVSCPQLEDTVDFLALHSFARPFLYLVLAMLRLLSCALFSHCGEWGYSPAAARGLLIAVASLVVEHGLSGLSSHGSWALENGLISCGPQA